MNTKIVNEANTFDVEENNVFLMRFLVIELLKEMISIFIKSIIMKE